MDLTFSTEERLSILRVMWDVSISDGHLAASEIAAMATASVAIGIQEHEAESMLDAALKRSVSSSLLCLGKMQTEKKAATFIFLKELIHADGVVDSNEMEIAKAIISHMT